jgi:hypothetical protein
MNKVKYLIIHCTDTRQGREVSSDEIRRWHTLPVERGGRGWKQVGYEGIFHLNGAWEQLVENNDDSIVDLREVTNGAKGYNGIARHWVYVGGVNKFGEKFDTRTDLQLEAMRKKVTEFHLKFPDVKIIGHNEVSAKSCPNFDVQKWLKSINIYQL